MPEPHDRVLVAVDQVAKKIRPIRGLRVMLDRDLAALYGVKPIALRQQVKRNEERFPADFMIQLTSEEADFLVSQSVIPSRRSLGGFLPYAFTQEGVAMLSSVLRSPRAVEVNIAIMRAFIRLRQLVAAHADLGLGIRGKRLAEYADGRRGLLGLGAVLPARRDRRPPRVPEDAGRAPPPRAAILRSS